MKKKLLLVLSLLIIIFMTSCSSSKTYSFKEAVGYEISNINAIKASESVYQSYAWTVSDEVYEYLDCKFVKVDFDINAEVDPRDWDGDHEPIVSFIINIFAIIFGMAGI